MKQLIVMIAMVVLGISIFNLIAGGDEGSIVSVVKGVWGQEIEMRTGSP
ncbi:MAG: hypothetical protein ACOX4P_06245 [Anaerovoracaceae bacterium]|jgi:hypothetical protein